MDSFSTLFEDYSYKLNTELKLALELTNIERNRTIDLNTGYNDETDIWNVIIRYNGNINNLSIEIGFDYISLLQNFAIVKITTNKIALLLQANEILYIEKPKKLYEEIILERKEIQGSCFNINNISMNMPERDQYILMAVIDSGIDVFHPQFINEDGTSKIEIMWNQRLAGNPPENYKFGTEYTNEDINNLLKENNNREKYLNIFDNSGHGTAVASVLADLTINPHFVIVAIQNDTLALICAIDYVIRYAIEKNLPLVLNLSFGNNYGDHAGNSILEKYIDSVAYLGKFTFVTGMGNEGNTGRHKSISIEADETQYVDILVQPGLKAFNLQLWTENLSYNFALNPPSIANLNNQIRVQLGEPSPYNSKKENYISVFSNFDYLQSGVWTLVIENNINQRLDIELWLPVSPSTSADVRFLYPDNSTSFTIPASAENVISVGAIDTIRMTVPSFSGRGYTSNRQIKPDLVAPGVDIKVARVGGGETFVTGTSFSVPFVSAAAYQLMQVGILYNYDSYLYGQKVKSYLQTGANVVPGYKIYPNTSTGYGALCLTNSLKLI